MKEAKTVFFFIYNRTTFLITSFFTHILPENIKQEEIEQNKLLKKRGRKQKDLYTALDSLRNMKYYNYITIFFILVLTISTANAYTLGEIEKQQQLITNLKRTLNRTN